MTIITISILCGTVLFLTLFFTLIVYFSKRNTRVYEFRLDLIKFCSEKVNEHEERFGWYENEIQPYDEMLWSLKNH